jgi:hypothetical protein
MCARFCSERRSSVCYWYPGTECFVPHSDQILILILALNSERAPGNALSQRLNKIRLTLAQNSNPTYPTAKFTYQQEGQVATALRSLLDSNGYTSVRIVGYEHNWDDAGEYPVELVRADSLY